jgi:hypothetical protein
MHRSIFYSPRQYLEVTFSGERDLGTHWIRGWVGPRAGLDDVEKRKCFTLLGFGRHAIAYLVKALCYKPKSRGFDSPM